MPTQEANASPQLLCENLLARPCNPPALRQETTQDSDKRIRFAGSVSLSASCTEYRVEKSHSFIAPLVDCWILNVFYKTVFEERARRKGYFPVRTNAERQVLW